MRYYGIVDSGDTKTGLRLAGIESEITRERTETIEAITKARLDPTIGILLISEKLSALCPEIVSEMKLSSKTPVLVEIPDRHGTGRSKDSITRYVRESIGIKI